VFMYESEGEIKRQRDTESERPSERARETERQRDSEKERDKHKDREREREKRRGVCERDQREGERTRAQDTKIVVEYNNPSRTQKS
jgi:U4/U6.U5 tri-snRNP-associated protein 1